MYESTVHLRPTHPLEVSLLHPKSKGVFRLRGRLLSLAGAPPIHFGREEGVERTLLRVACQSETFLASPWQGDANIRFLWHIGCQSEFDELVSLTSRPVDRGVGRTGNTLDAVSSCEKPVWPDGKHLNAISSGEKPVWPDGNVLRQSRSRQKTHLGRERRISGCIAGSQPEKHL